MYFLIVKINIFRETKAIFRPKRQHWITMSRSAHALASIHDLFRLKIFRSVWAIATTVGTLGTRISVLAEILLRSPQQLFIFIINNNIYRINVSKK